jgi:two-component system LytT family response regulator
MTLRTLVCEDEPLARLHLRELIAATEALTLVGEAADGDRALEAIERLRPDLVFLDITMPGRDGLAVLGAARHQPMVVFTTAYDAHAVAAFELGAVDYLLKPFGAERFATAVARVRSRAGTGASTGATAAPASHLVVRHGGRLVPVAVEAITHLTADDDVVQLHVNGRTLAISETLGALLERLDAQRFIRVHRSSAVNLDHVAALEPRDTNRLQVRLRDGTLVPASRTGTQALRTRLGR